MILKRVTRQVHKPDFNNLSIIFFLDITLQIVIILGVLGAFYKMPFLYGSSIKSIGHTSSLFYTVSAQHRLNTIFSVVILTQILEMQRAKNGQNTNFDIVLLPIFDGTVTRSNITWEWKKVQP